MSSIIDLKNITKTYTVGENNIQALKDVSFNVQAGELVSIMGTSGSGKSTLMNIIGLLDNPDTGDYYLTDKDVSQLNDNQMATLRNRLIGFVFQSFFLLPRLTALDNVCLPLIYRNIRGAAAEELAMHRLEQVGMADYIAHQPNELSGGQQQRIAIARALVGNPSVILADEPTGALDSKTSQDVMDLFIQLNEEQSTTIVIITHDPNVAEQCKRSVHVKDGLVINDNSISVTKASKTKPTQEKDQPKAAIAKADKKTVEPNEAKTTQNKSQQTQTAAKSKSKQKKKPTKKITPNKRQKQTIATDEANVSQQVPPTPTMPMMPTAPEQLEEAHTAITSPVDTEQKISAANTAKKTSETKQTQTKKSQTKKTATKAKPKHKPTKTKQAAVKKPTTVPETSKNDQTSEVKIATTKPAPAKKSTIAPETSKNSQSSKVKTAKDTNTPTEPATDKASSETKPSMQPVVIETANITRKTRVVPEQPSQKRKPDVVLPPKAKPKRKVKRPKPDNDKNTE